MLFPILDRTGSRENEVIGSIIAPVRTVELYKHRDQIEKHGDGKLILSNTQSLGFGKEYIDISWLEGAAEVYNISKDPKDFVIADVPILTIDFPNRNSQSFPFEEVSYFDPMYGTFVYKTFIGKPTYINHDNKVPQKARGVHFDSSLQYVPKWHVWKTRVLTGWDRSKDSATANKVLKNKDVGYSMGAYVDSFMPVSGESLIRTSHGLVKIKWVPKNEIVDTGDGQEHCGGVIYQGYRCLHTIETRHGFELNPEESHPVLVLTKDLEMKYIPANEVKKGMFVAIRKKATNLWPESLEFIDFVPASKHELDKNRQVECQLCGEKLNQLQRHLKVKHNTDIATYKDTFGKYYVNASNTNSEYDQFYPKEMTDELARIIGYILSDGAITAEWKLLFNNTKKELVDDFARCIKSVFGIEVEVVEHKSTNHYKDGYTCRMGFIGLEKFLSYLGLCPTDSNYNEIPWSILQAPKSCVINFIQAFWESDGSARAIHEAVSFHNTSKKLLKQMQILLLNLGIPAWLDWRENCYSVLPNGNECTFDIGVLSCFGDMVDKFIEVIGCITDERRQDLINVNRSSRQLIQWYNIIPYIKEKVDNLYNKYHTVSGIFDINGVRKKVKLYRLELKDGSEYCYNHLAKYDKLIDNIKELDTDLGKKIQDIYDYDVMWEEVVINKRSSILQPVYCLKDVEKVHNFTANGFVVHNCSICGNLHSNKQPCSCMKMGRGSIINGKICYQLCIGACFFETSQVDEPADSTAYGNTLGLLE